MRFGNDRLAPRRMSLDRRDWLDKLGIDSRLSKRYDLARPMDDLAWIVMVKEILRNHNRRKGNATSRSSAE
jgi:hypothetical protein